MITKLAYKPSDIKGVIDIKGALVKAQRSLVSDMQIRNIEDHFSGSPLTQKILSGKEQAFPFPVKRPPLNLLLYYLIHTRYTKPYM